ncbi:hypothetical protein [Halalkalibacter krulwichiae]|uniref:Uncharacterized protein n=1 Tax=Halalkalibacter krulwichiae TaxID=199441 RepID=A0A1X9MLQ4_9BACI|nr:hypothetical protein [Halalkalibacter krulwichiae]ARK31852.1 hypothetical protein BkAM31D_19545 [Halalkalibacter krulwichiae]
MRVYCDFELKLTDEALIIGADYRVLNDENNYSTVKIASLYETEMAGASLNACVRFALCKLIDEMPGGFDSIKFRSVLSLMSRTSRLKAVLKHANEQELEVKFLQKFFNSDACDLLEDAEKRKSSVTETI